jgi:predicted RNA binding protein YcfA (HicA-like mRNA interferase family)
MHDGDDVIVSLQANGFLDARIVGSQSRLPHHAIPEAMRG